MTIPISIFRMQLYQPIKISFGIDIRIGISTGAYLKYWHDSKWFALSSDSSDLV